MPVYLDDAKHPYKNMLMCHVVADTHQELLAMMKAIGVDARHIQYKGTYKEHFDICKSKRALAIASGAREVSSRDIVRKMNAKKTLSALSSHPPS